MTRTLRLLPLLPAALIVACASDSPESPVDDSLSPEAHAAMMMEAAETITEADYFRRISVIAHDSMGGRDTPSPGLEATAAWIASEFEAMGLRPGGDAGSFIQRYTLLDFRDSFSPEVTAPNVAGILEGSDPELKDEYIVYSAHMDHVGMRSPDANGDSIWNGADDDASGTTAVIEVAEAFASMPVPPRRSMIFLLVSGEERGLWGSRHFAENPGVPIGDIVANFNADMVGRNWSDTIVVIGKEHSDLGTTMNEVNARHPELNMTAIDDLWPDERFYFRSDHFSFARRGVPVLFFFNGTHEDYHGRDDEVEKIDVDKATRITKLMYYLGWEVSVRDARPEWDPESRREIVER